MKTAVVLGAGGFIGGAMCKRLKSEGYWVRGVDIKYHDFFDITKVCDDFVQGDLRDREVVRKVFMHPIEGHPVFVPVDEVYQFAADMGGAGFIFTGENDADIMHNSALINLLVAEQAKEQKVGKVFYSSSACMYPEYNQLDPDNPKCSEDSAYPAAPDSEYGWEKLFSERLYLSFARNHGLNVRIARYHNIYGPEGTWQGGREKAPAAFCRKAAQAPRRGEIEVWGDGSRTRSFLYIDECIEATRRLMDSDFEGPVNIGSEEMITIQDFAHLVIGLSGKELSIKNIDGPLGVHGRNSDNNLYEKMIGWKVSGPLRTGMEKTYEWILEQTLKQRQ